MEKISKRKAAMKTIEQLKNNEWVFRWNLKSESALTCTRKGMKIWCGNGGFFTDIYDLNYFGYFWRHIVWWKGVRPKKKEFEEKYRRAWMEKIRSDYGKRN